MSSPPRTYPEDDPRNPSFMPDPRGPRRYPRRDDPLDPEDDPRSPRYIPRDDPRRFPRRDDPYDLYDPEEDPSAPKRYSRVTIKRACAVCGKTTGNLTMCECRKVYYCTEAHQSSHWKTHRLTPYHKEERKQNKKERMQRKGRAEQTW